MIAREWSDVALLVCLGADPGPAAADSVLSQGN